MNLRRNIAALYLLLFLPVWLFSQAEDVDLSMIYRIKQQGTNNSEIDDYAFWLTDYSGSRLTGSTGIKRANEWVMQKMQEIGLQNVRIEEAGDFRPGGWDNLKSYAAMTVPYYVNFACNPVAWTGSTNGLIRDKVILMDIKSENDLEKFRGIVTGKIILLSSLNRYEISFEPYASRYTDAQLKELTLESPPAQQRLSPVNQAELTAQRLLRTKIIDFLMNEKAGVILNSSGVFNVPGSTRSNYNGTGPEPVPELNLPVEAHGRIERLLRNDIPVEMEIEIHNSFLPGQKVYNVIGEIPGTDKLLKNEVVLIGAHIDSWHGGTGAADNASGCIVMLEAMRILKALNINPRRTIRIALWGGEEQGYFGSKGYSEKYLFNPVTKEYKTGYGQFAAYFNMDNGSGRFRGIYIQQNEMVRPLFEKWLKPFADMGCSTITLRNTTGTDHLTFDAIGLPAFQFIQDRLEYSRSYHTVMDTYERLQMPDLKINAMITASFVYNAATQNEKLTGKPDKITSDSPGR